MALTHPAACIDGQERLLPGNRRGRLEDYEGVAIGWARGRRDFTTGGAGHAAK